LPGRPGKVGTGIRTPVAEKSNDPRFKFSHFLPP
jgi:hypothetical protein